MATTFSLACIAFVFMESLCSLAEDPGWFQNHEAPAEEESVIPVCLAFAAVSRSYHFLSPNVSLSVQYMPVQTLGIPNFVTTISCLVGEKRVSVSQSWCGVYTQVLSFLEPAGAPHHKYF